MPPEVQAQPPANVNDSEGPRKPLNGSPSLYSLRTIPVASAPHSPTSPRLEELAHVSNETTSLLSASGNQRTYTGLAKYMPALDPDARKLVFRAGLKVLLLFVVGSILLGGTLWVYFPHSISLENETDPASPPAVCRWTSFASSLACSSRVVLRDSLQAFSLPGSMYLSILGGAVWGVPRALPLCVATGATLCYLISAALGPALLAVPSWRARLDTWSEKIESQRENLMSYLIVIRIAPFPPHWVVNVLCPHVGIGIPRFWISTFFGIMGVSVIHTTIGGTSLAEGHEVSLQFLWYILKSGTFGMLVVLYAIGERPRMVSVGSLDNFRSLGNRRCIFTSTMIFRVLSIHVDLEHHGANVTPDMLACSGPRPRFRGTPISTSAPRVDQRHPRVGLSLLGGPLSARRSWIRSTLDTLGYQALCSGCTSSSNSASPTIDLGASIIRGGVEHARVACAHVWCGVGRNLIFPIKCWLAGRESANALGRLFDFARSPRVFAAAWDSFVDVECVLFLLSVWGWGFMGDHALFFPLFSCPIRSGSDDGTEPESRALR
ncbi:transmembrane protein [Rhizoctonia solani AG-1 IA]|uniref:Transmembrane protein n=1 Tax=Thanatephorus cucumeris (strain AG1-IA) TaxID=983506 RepID=L8WTS5_THACA|nr:transmembrane protein [Rhizoctonia solani AG-1 IA]